MSDWLLDLPIWLTALLVIGGSVLVSIGMVCALRPWITRRHREGHNEVTSYSFAAMTLIYAVVAGFLVFSMFDTFATAERTTAAEGSALVALYRNAHQFPQPERSRTEDAIVRYTRSVIRDEWPAMAKGEESTITRAALDRIFVVLGPMVPTASWSEQYQLAATQLDEVSKDRTQRKLVSQASLPDVFWFLLILGMVVTIVFSSLFYMQDVVIHALGVALMTVVIASVLFLLAEMNHPFHGDVAISPEAFRTALTAFGRIGP